ncbi:MAG: glycosyltransferase family 39 protein [Planctomycetota bacterium]
MLVSLCFAVYLPGLFTTPPIDRDEARFAQASRQMFESVALPEADRDTRPLSISDTGEVTGGFHAGGLVVPMVQDVPRLNKPPLIYWLQAGSAWACTRGDPLADAIWMYRLPSVAGSIAAVLATYWMGRRMFTRPVALLGASLLGVCAVVVFDAHQARADQVLLGLTTVSMALLWSLVRGARFGRRRPALTWLALWTTVGLGVLVKGVSPVVVFSTLVAMGVFGGSWSAWQAARPIVGLVVVAALIAPWALGVAQRVGFETYVSIVFDETVARGSQAKEGHVGPPGYHVAFLWAVFWPGTIAVLLGLAWAWRRWMAWGRPGSRWRTRRPGAPAVFFLVCWIVPTWVFFELYATKLPHYVLPTYPAVALLAARGVLAASPGRGLRKAGAVIFGLVGVGVGGAGVVGAVTMDLLRPSAWMIVPASVALIVCVGLTARLAWSGRSHRSAAAAVLCMIPLAWVVHAGILPSLTRFSPRLVERLARHDDGVRPIGAAGYHEDSLIFLTRGRAVRVVHTDAAAWLDRHPGGLLFARRLYRDEGGLDDGSFVTIDSLTGFQFASSDTVTVDFVEAAPR